MMTVHSQGGKKMLEEAMRGARDKAEELKIDRPYIVGVTALTSEKSEDINEIVLERAKIVKDAGLDGIVCSAREANIVRQACGGDFVIVTPGIRPKDSAPDDQSRVTTPQEAVEAGADFIVVGRPIIQSQDPLSAAKEILKDLEE